MSRNAFIYDYRIQEYFCISLVNFDLIFHNGDLSKMKRERADVYIYHRIIMDTIKTSLTHNMKIG